MTRIAALAAALALCMAATAATAVTAAAAGPAGGVRIGLQPDQLADSDIARMGQAGTDVIRLPLDWRLVQGAPDAPYDFAEHDRIIAAATAAGIQVLPVIAVSTPWAAKTPAEQPNDAVALRRHDAFVRAMVARYRPGGDFWLAHPELPQLALTEWQIWNEPNLKKHWTGRLHPSKYVPFLKRVRGVILEEDPDARIVLAGMPDHHQRYPCRDYLADLYEIDGVQRLFDAAAVNLYQRRPQGIESSLRALRRLMDRNGDREKEIWISEMGWASDGPTKNEAVTDIPGQARRLRQAFELLQQRGRRYRNDTAIWFTLRDRVREPHIRDRFWFHSGLFFADGSPKPAWADFARLAGGDPGSGNVSGG
jgi:hypothetical protein